MLDMQFICGEVSLALLYACVQDRPVLMLDRVHLL